MAHSVGLRFRLYCVSGETRFPHRISRMMPFSMLPHLEALCLVISLFLFQVRCFHGFWCFSLFQNLSSIRRHCYTFILNGVIFSNDVRSASATCILHDCFKWRASEGAARKDRGTARTCVQAISRTCTHLHSSARTFPHLKLSYIPNKRQCSVIIILFLCSVDYFWYSM